MENGDKRIQEKNLLVLDLRREARLLPKRDLHGMQELVVMLRFQVQDEMSEVLEGKMNPTSQIKPNDDSESQFDAQEPGITSVPLEVEHQEGLQILWGYTWARHYYSKETSGGPCLGKGTVATIKQLFTLSTLEEYDCFAKRGSVGVQYTILGLINAQQYAMEEFDRLSMLVAQREDDMALLKAAQISKETVTEPGAVLDLQRENAQLTVENTTLRS
ncbi:hypothetical protein HAX54_003798 [Datura stramonium]|uniref:Uncharacterized protein n=1 Tax=Datura stramonium TaxID=4076 RepID=A0ABS8T5X3_DATST|nr:hypothetical protein [Datura stramonium]